MPRFARIGSTTLRLMLCAGALVTAAVSPRARDAGGSWPWSAARAIADDAVASAPEAAAGDVPAAGQAANAAGGDRAAEDDPFADELNPFGKGKPARPRPAMPPAQDDQTPPAAPAPEAAEPAPDAKPRSRGKPRPKLPVPFPDAPADDDSTTKVPDGSSATGERRPQPGAWSGGIDREPSPSWEDLTEAEKEVARATQLAESGKLEEARQLLLALVEKEPSFVAGHLTLAVVLRRLGDLRGSVEACTKGLEIDPQQAELYLRRGIAWFHMGLHGIALVDFEEAAGIAYDDPRPELWRGLALMEQDQPFEAINAYASAIRRDRTYMLAYLNRGLAYLSTDEPRKAESDFNQAIRQNPKNARNWFNRGVAQVRQGRIGEAIFSYETALGIEPGYTPARRNLEAIRGMRPRSTAIRTP